MSWFRSSLVAVVLVTTTSTTALASDLDVSGPVIGQAIPTEPVAVLDGQLEMPANPLDLGVLVERGNLLVIGHRDWAGTLLPFAYLDALAPGDVVELSDGRAYSVRDTFVWDVDDGEAEWADAVAPTDGDVLTMISCTGAFSRSRHEYLQRIVVRAVRT